MEPLCHTDAVLVVSLVVLAVTSRYLTPFSLMSDFLELDWDSMIFVSWYVILSALSYPTPVLVTVQPKSIWSQRNAPYALHISTISAISPPRRSV